MTFRPQAAQAARRVSQAIRSMPGYPKAPQVSSSPAAQVGLTGLSLETVATRERQAAQQKQQQFGQGARVYGNKLEQLRNMEKNNFSGVQSQKDVSRYLGLRNELGLPKASEARLQRLSDKGGTPVANVQHGKVLSLHTPTPKLDPFTQAISTGVFSPAAKAIAIANRPSEVIASAVDAALKGKGLSGAGSAALSAIEHGSNTSFSNVLGDLGVHSKALRAIGGFAGDVLTNPLTYTTAGLESAASRAAGEGAAKVAGEAAGRGATVGVRAKVPFADALQFEKSAVVPGSRAVGRALSKASQGEGIRIPRPIRSVTNSLRGRSPTVAKTEPVNPIRGAQRAASTVRPAVAPVFRSAAEHQTIRSALGQLRHGRALESRANADKMAAYNAVLKPAEHQQVIDAIERTPSTPTWTAYEQRVADWLAANKGKTEADAHAALASSPERAALEASRASIDKLPPHLQTVAKEFGQDMQTHRDLLQSRGILDEEFKPTSPLDAQGYVPHVNKGNLPGESAVKGAQRMNPKISAQIRVGRNIRAPIRIINERGPLFADRLHALYGLSAEQASHDVAFHDFWNKFGQTGRKIGKGFDPHAQIGGVHGDGVFEIRAGKPPLEVSKEVAGGGTVPDFTEIQKILDGKREGEFRVFNRQSVDLAKKQAGQMSAAAGNPIGRTFDRLQGRAKLYMTMLNPGFQGRNLLSELQMGYQGDMTAHSLLQSVRAQRALWAARHAARSPEVFAGERTVMRAAEGHGNPTRGQQIIDQRYGGDVRAALKGTHPDQGGKVQDFKDVQAARTGTQPPLRPTTETAPGGPKTARAEKLMGRPIDIGQGRTASVGDLLHEAGSRGVLFGGHFGSQVRQELGGGVQTHRLMSAINEYRENAPRFATFLSALKRGQNFDQAAQHALNHHFDYGEFTPTEQGVLRRVFPFYTFTARNVVQQVKNLVSRPGKFPAIAAGFNEAAKAAGYQNYQQYAAQHPEYQQRLLPVPINIGGKTFDWYGQSPLIDLNLVGEAGSPTALGLELADRASLAKVIPELVLNYSTFLQGPVEKPGSPLVAAPQILGSLPGPVRAMLGLKQMSDPKTGKMIWGWPAKLNYALRQLPQSSLALNAATPGASTAGSLPLTISNFLSGVKLVPMNAGKNALNALYTQQTNLTNQLGALQQQLGRDPGTGKFRDNQQTLSLKAQLKAIQQQMGAAKVRAGTSPGQLPSNQRSGLPQGWQSLGPAGGGGSGGWQSLGPLGGGGGGGTPVPSGGGWQAVGP